MTRMRAFTAIIERCPVARHFVGHGPSPARNPPHDR